MRIPENKQYILFGGAFILANKMQLVADRMVEGLSTKQWFLLRNLKDLPLEPPPTITKLAKETDTSRQNVSKMLVGLQRQGYVVLCGNSEDRRSQVIEITEQGSQILAQVAEEANPFFEELFLGISRKECEAAGRVIIKMIENLHKMQQDME